MQEMNNDRPKYYSSIYSYDNNFSCGDNYNDKKSKQRKKKERFKMSKIICSECGFDEGTLLKEFDNNKSYYWSELSEMTEVCASCDSEKLEREDK